MADGTCSHCSNPLDQCEREDICLKVAEQIIETVISESAPTVMRGIACRRFTRLENRFGEHTWAALFEEALHGRAKRRREAAARAAGRTP